MSNVGYKKPPKKTQFKPGQSGNPRGRPKGNKDPSAILKQLFNKHVSIVENGEHQKVSTLELLLKRLLHKAAGGDLKAMQITLNLMRDYGIHRPELGEEPSTFTLKIDNSPWEY